MARDGYVNLLPVQHKRSRDPGDAADAVKARRAFLEAGHYRPLRDAIPRLAAEPPVRNVVDIGCGEGYYTSALTAAAPDVVGVDIARPAIQFAARRYPGLTWLVASGSLLPLADGSVDAVTTLFSQLHVAEMHRVLKPGGRLLVVTPAADHLWALRQGLFEEVHPHEPDKFLPGLAPLFHLRERGEVRVALQLAHRDLRHLVAMTPYAWKAKPERRAAVEAMASLTTQAAFAWLRFERKPVAH